MTNILDLSTEEELVTKALSCANNTSAIEAVFTSKYSCGERRFSWWWHEDSDPTIDKFMEIAVFADHDNIVRTHGEEKRVLVKPCRIELAQRLLSTDKPVAQPAPTVFAFRPLTTLALTSHKPDYTIVKLLEREVLALTDV